MRETWRTARMAYLVALVGTGLVVFVLFSLTDMLTDRVPLLLPLIGVVFLAAWCGGLRPGLLATGLAFVIALVIRNEQSVPPSLPVTDRTRLAMFLMEGLAISCSFEAMHRARARLERKQQQLQEEVKERRQAQEELVVADRRKNEFLATLAHELRNPLAPLCNCLEIMRRSNAEPARMKQAQAVMERQVQQMIRLVEDLLDISRISRNKLELRKEQIPLQQVLQNAVETSKLLIESFGHHLTITLPNEPIRLNVDPLRMAQVFSNLLNNAAKYSQPGGQIWLKARRADTEVEVEVRDTGIGISADMLSRIFDMYTQVDAARDRSGGGLGIGLALVKRLTEMHGGRIEVQSDGPGKGCSFFVRLPIQVDAKNDPVEESSFRPKQLVATARRMVPQK